MNILFSSSSMLFIPFKETLFSLYLVSTFKNKNKNKKKEGKKKKQTNATWWEADES